MYQVKTLNSWSQFYLLITRVCNFWNFHTSKLENKEDLNKKKIQE